MGAAIDYARGATAESLNGFEKRAYDIVKGKKRVRAPASTEAISRRRRLPEFLIAEKIKRDWTKKLRKRREHKEGDLAGTDLIDIVVPILDEFAGREVPGGEPKGLDPMTMQPPSIAILFALAKNYGRRTSPKNISRLLREYRKRTLPQTTE